MKSVGVQATGRLVAAAQQRRMLAANMSCAPTHPLSHPPRSPAQAQYLLRNEGLFVGSSAAMNCVGAVKVARALGSGHTIVTVLCDGGHRHLSKFHSPAYLAESGLTPEAAGRGLGFVE